MSYREARERVKRLWGEQAGTWAVGRGRHWLEHPKVQERINLKITGRPNLNRYHQFVFEDLGGRVPVGRALTVGCGAGDLERGLAKLCNFCVRHDALDVSDAAVEKARKLAGQAAYTHIRYWVSDLNSVQLEKQAYDVVFGISSVHHVAKLELLYGQISRALKPRGCFYMDEFIGPSQFQWSDQQLDAVNRMLERIPERLRVRQSTGTVKERVMRPSIAEMNADDPSEAIRSEEIVPLLAERFPDFLLRGYGGNILHLLLEDIAGNFGVITESGV